MSDYITIQLSKQGKNKGKYEAIVDEEDAILAQYNWSVYISFHQRQMYAVRERDKKSHRMHREVLARKLQRELLPEEGVDHIDGNGLNNRRSNLRLATKSQNGMNRGKIEKSKSGVKGVYWNKERQKWYANIRVNGKTYYLGSFKKDRLEDAAQAYRDAADKYHKDFAKYD